MKTYKYTIFGHCVLICHIIFPQVSIINALIGPNVESVAEGEFPFIVGLVQRYPNFFGQRPLVCTSTLITRRDILTAAHCLEDETFSAVGVIVGSIDITSEPNNILIWCISYDSWVTHTGIVSGYIRNDIAIARLQQSVSKDWKIAKIKYMPNEELKGKHATAAGWGKINVNLYPLILQKGKVKILSKRECEHRVHNLIHERRNFTVNYVCSIGDPYAVLMNGDSGGPLLYHNSIIAINTGTTPMTDDDHFYPDILNLNLNVYFYKDYIKYIVTIK